MPATARAGKTGNGRYCGGGMRQTPDALPDDGMLDITVIKVMGRIKIIQTP